QLQARIVDGVQTRSAAARNKGVTIFDIKFSRGAFERKRGFIARFGREQGSGATIVRRQSLPRTTGLELSFGLRPDPSIRHFTKPRPVPDIVLRGDVVRRRVAI